MVDGQMARAGQPHAFAHDIDNITILGAFILSEDVAKFLCYKLIGSSA